MQLPSWSHSNSICCHSNSNPEVYTIQRKFHKYIHGIPTHVLPCANLKGVEPITKKKEVAEKHMQIATCSTQFHFSYHNTQQLHSYMYEYHNFTAWSVMQTPLALLGRNSEKYVVLKQGMWNPVKLLHRYIHTQDLNRTSENLAKLQKHRNKRHNEVESSFPVKVRCSIWSHFLQNKHKLLPNLRMNSPSCWKPHSKPAHQ